MKKLLYYAAAAALVYGANVAIAHAQGWNFHFERHYEWHSALPNARIIAIDPPMNDADRQAQEDETKRWEAFCQPRIVRDNLGVGYYHYAHEGCDTGRTE